MANEAFYRLIYSLTWQPFRQADTADVGDSWLTTRGAILEFFQANWWWNTKLFCVRTLDTTGQAQPLYSRGNADFACCPKGSTFFKRRVGLVVQELGCQNDKEQTMMQLFFETNLHYYLIGFAILYIVGQWLNKLMCDERSAASKMLSKLRHTFTKEYVSLKKPPSPSDKALKDKREIYNQRAVDINTFMAHHGGTAKLKRGDKSIFVKLECLSLADMHAVCGELVIEQSQIKTINGNGPEVYRINLELSTDACLEELANSCRRYLSSLKENDRHLPNCSR